jgi:predicted dehydrogenase
MINRILIVGLGSIGKRHLKIARDFLPTADIRILRHKPNNEIPEHSNGCFFNIEDAIAFSPTMAVIASPAPFHIVTAQKLAEAGVHLFIEKPLSTSQDGVVQLIKACQKQRTVILTGYNLRFLPSLQRFRNFLNQGVIGKVLSVRCQIGQYLPSWRPESDYRFSVTANQKLGGGALLELSHEIDYIRWIFGEVEWVASILSRQSNLEIDVEDVAHLILGFTPQLDGYQLIATLNLDLFRHDTTRECIAIGEKGSLRWDGLTGQVMFYQAGEKTWQEIFKCQHQLDESYRLEWKHFLECILEKKVPLIPAEEGLKVLEIIDAARNSSKLGSFVPVRLDRKNKEI